MISNEMVEEVRRLLAEDKLSQRKIARLLRISRGTVGAISMGRRPDYEALRADSDDLLTPPGPASRCPTCGGKVYLPCRLCRERHRAKSSPVPPWQDAQDPSVELQLKEEHQSRYEAVRACRELGIPITQPMESTP